MKVLIVDQCSGSKDYRDSSPVLDAEEIDSTSRAEALSRDGVPEKTAKDLYSGRQQAFIDEATTLLREADVEVDRYFVSAGFGLVEESTYLPPYEVTFSSMSNKQIRARSAKLGIQKDLIDVVADDAYDIVFLPLGADYYTALDLPELFETVGSDTTVVVFNQDEVEDQYENVLSLDARTDEAREFGVIVVELKGKLIKNFAEQTIDRGIVSEPSSVRDYCTYNPQGNLGSFAD